MQPTKTSGRILGLLFLASAISGGVGTSMRGLSGAHSEPIAFLQNLSENANQMKLAIGLDILGSLIAVGIAIYMYPFIKNYSTRLAITYFGIGLITFTMVAVSNVFHISLLGLGNEYVNATEIANEYFTTMGLMGYEAYYGLHFLILILYAIGGFVLFTFFFRTGLIPKWLAVWGILANCIVFVGGALQFFDIPVSFYLFVQNGIFALAFIIWLLIMGFRPIKLTEKK